MTLRKRLEEVLLMYRYCRLGLCFSRWDSLMMAWSLQRSATFRDHLIRMREALSA